MRLPRSFVPFLMGIAISLGIMTPAIADQLSVTVPTEVHMVVKEDGTIVGPSDAKIQNFGSTEAHVLGFKTTAKVGTLDTVENAKNTDKADVVGFTIAPNGGIALENNVAQDTHDSEEWNLAVAGSDGSIITLTYAGHVSDLQTLKTEDEGGVNFSNTVWTVAAGHVLTEEEEYNDETNQAKGEWGTAKWWIDSTGTLHIGSGNAVGLNVYNEFYQPWYEQRNLINRVTTAVNGKKTFFPNKVNGLFAGCTNLVSIDLTGADLSNTSYINRLFSGDSRLTSVYLTGVSTSTITDMGDMFKGCSSLNNLDLSSFDTSKVTDMGDMFNGCSSLNNLDLSSFDTSKVTNMGHMFAGCSNLTTIDISNFDMSNVKYIDAMFQNCDGLTSYDLTSFDLKNVEKANGLFHGCDNLTFVNLSHQDMPKLSESFLLVGPFADRDWAKGMFADCPKLKSVDLSYLNVPSLTTMTAMFSGDSSLTSVDFTGVDTSSMNDMRWTFIGCTSLASLDLSSLKTDNVTNMSGMFDGCSGLTSLRTGDDFGIKAAKSYNKATLPIDMYVDGSSTITPSGTALLDGAHTYTTTQASSAKSMEMKDTETMEDTVVSDS